MTTHLLDNQLNCVLSCIKNIFDLIMLMSSGVGKFYWVFAKVRHFKVNFNSRKWHISENIFFGGERLLFDLPKNHLEFVFILSLRVVQIQFSFPLIGCHTTAEEANLSNYLPIEDEAMDSCLWQVHVVQVKSTLRVT